MRIVMIVLLLAAVLLLGACGTTVEKVPFEVKVPVAVSCVDPADIPKVVPTAAEQLRIEDSPGAKIKAVLIERERLRNSDTMFRALMQGCLL